MITVRVHVTRSEPAVATASPGRDRRTGPGGSMLVRGLRLIRRPRDDRGAVAVEAAFITPVLLLLVFGMIDMSLLIKDNVAVVSSVRAGARVASAEASVPGATVRGVYVPGFAADTVAAMNRATANLDRVETTTGSDGTVTTGTVLFLT